jgi:hypothetical protein
MAVSAPAEAGASPNAGGGSETESAAESEGGTGQLRCGCRNDAVGRAGGTVPQLSDMPGGLLSIVILFVGIQIAWKTTGSPTGDVRDAITASGSDDTPTSLNISR